MPCAAACPIRSLPFAGPGRLATNGNEPVLPLRSQHVYGCRMGGRDGAGRCLQSHRSGLPAVDGRGAGGRIQGRNHHSEASRRFLPVAFSGEFPYSGTEPLAERTRGRSAGTFRCLCGRRPEVRGLYFSLGQARSALRVASLQCSIRTNTRERARRCIRTGL